MNKIETQTNFSKKTSQDQRVEQNRKFFWESSARGTDTNILSSADIDRKCARQTKVKMVSTGTGCQTSVQLHPQNNLSNQDSVVLNSNA